MNLTNRVKAFVRKYGYQRAEWDGEELTLFNHKKEPWTSFELDKDSLIRIEWEGLEEDLIGRFPGVYKGQE